MVQRGRDGGGRSPPMPLLVVPNVTAQPSTSSVAITVLLYSGPLYINAGCVLPVAVSVKGHYAVN